MLFIGTLSLNVTSFNTTEHEVVMGNVSGVFSMGQPRFWGLCMLKSHFHPHEDILRQRLLSSRFEDVEAEVKLEVRQSAWGTELVVRHLPSSITETQPTLCSLSPCRRAARFNTRGFLSMHSLFNKHICEMARSRFNGSPLYAWGIHSKTLRGCLRPQREPDPTLFSPTHIDLW